MDGQKQVHTKFWTQQHWSCITTTGPGKAALAQAHCASSCAGNGHTKAFLLPFWSGHLSEENSFFFPIQVTRLFLNVNHRPHPTRDVLQVRSEALPTVCEVHPAFGWLPWRRRSPFGPFPANSCHITCSRRGTHISLFYYQVNFSFATM